MTNQDKEIKEKLLLELKNYNNNSSTAKDYFLSSKELSAWLKDKEK